MVFDSIVSSHMQFEVIVWLLVGNGSLEEGGNVPAVFLERTLLVTVAFNLGPDYAKLGVSGRFSMC